MISPEGYTEVDGNSLVGLYAADGTTNVVDSVVAVDDNGNPLFVGMYHPCGALWVTFVETPNPELHAANGSINIYVEPEEEE
jgi:hypothetical protein